MKNLKFLSLVLALVMIFSVGCSSTTEPVPENNEQEIIQKTDEEPVVEGTEDSSAVEDAAIAYLVEKPADSYMIGSADLFAKMDAGEDMFLLDIRQNDVYSEAHLKGAVNVPWGPNFAEEISKLSMDKTIYLNCYSSLY